MKYTLTVIALFLSIAAHCQLVTEQTSNTITYAQWQEEAKSNYRLLPEYGNLPKTDKQVQADKEFIERSLKLDTTELKASAQMVKLGFRYFNRRDTKTAMYRFNQAWLLYPKNENAYWGFGAIYLSFGDYEKAIEMYDKGLAINPGNTQILTDKATLYMAMLNDKFDRAVLDKALKLFGQSYSIDPHNANTTYKMSTLYYSQGDCKAAKRYYDECMHDGGQPISQEYTKALEEACGK